MFEYTFKKKDYFNSHSEQFESAEGTYQFELSLKTIAEWESKECKPFFTTKLTTDTLVPLIQEMCTTKFPTELMDDTFISELSSYITESHTATTIHSEPETPSSNGSYMTSELVYAMMFELHIPLACEVWNINRLMTLIRVMQIRAQPQKKMGSATVAERNRALNAQRRAQLKTKG